MILLERRALLPKRNELLTFFHICAVISKEKLSHPSGQNTLNPKRNPGGNPIRFPINIYQFILCKLSEVNILEVDIFRFKGFGICVRGHTHEGFCLGF